MIDIPTNLTRVQLADSGAVSQRPLQAGQVLQGRVIGQAATAGQPVQLRLGGQTVEARLPVHVQTGDSLRLQVASVKPRLELTLMREAPRGASPGMNSTLPPLLRQWAPQQGSQAPLMASLQQLNQTGSPAAQQLPAAVRQALEALWQAIPNRESAMTGEGLRQVMRDSGLFLEARLAGAAATRADPRGIIHQDLKSRLLSLAEQIRSTPAPRSEGRTALGSTPPPLRDSAPVAQARAAPAQLANLMREPLLDTLRQQVERSLARMVMHQLSSADSPDEATPRWLMELALRNGQNTDLVHLRLDRDARQNHKDNERSWRADLALHLPELGPLTIRVVVRGNHVSTQFWTDSDTSRATIQEALPQLRVNLESRDLQVLNITCREGEPPENPPSPAASSARGPIVDGHA
ncbi:flagellar hook-length control protein FliK [Ectothiorhodospira haloalkaliphila]|uniref:flagellar hook-length control protein FliK n=1 Tax=Ectothiorhodospira haloalkaliphila TaxID=421628 RepID=UPI001EE7FCCF|nr:flagellar hook-length control protein FliK [Ectothiorhodospira haloalkaliphila]MCG5525352.1 flagellar hook-length control protein FliK [Ectothiorhodospira haloalkaliphila]